MAKLAKGTYGYIRREKRRRLTWTVLFFGLLLAIYVVGLLTCHTRKNLYTFAVILGCLPASKVAVSAVMIWLQKPLDSKTYQTIREHVKDMMTLYEITVTSEEKAMPLSCVVISGLNVICYTADTKVEPAKLEQHLKKILQGNGYRANVKLFKDLKPFLRRVDELYPNHLEQEAEAPFRPDERNPEATRNELVKAVIQAISI